MTAALREPATYSTGPVEPAPDHLARLLAEQSAELLQLRRERATLWLELERERQERAALLRAIREQERDEQRRFLAKHAEREVRP